jgi:outer membrane cobalamin receptor
MAYRILFLSFLLLFIFRGEAQTGSISGSISDEQTKSPVRNVTVNLPEGKGSYSDELGNFFIPGITPGKYELTISHIGYKTEVIPVDVQENRTSAVSVRLRRSALMLEEIKVSGRRSQPVNTIAAIDIRLRPVNTSQDILRLVPGLFIAQHAGGGKAEQIFLRGYDIDHGTDINISVDGMPVNMVSHAHGQGYSDLHFLIPELVEKLSFNYGPYAVDKGNQATAGYVAFQTKDFLDRNMIKAEAGQFNTFRGVAAIRLLNTEKDNFRQQLYIAPEYFVSDGYFESPQDFHRLNLMAKYNALWKNNSQLTLIASTFDSKWNASGQIPQRAVDAGIIGRFGAIDDTEGGSTGRTNLSARFSNSWGTGWRTASQLYYSRYDFDLYSNFTFFLNDPVNGDQIRQRENRSIWGYNGTLSKDGHIGRVQTTSELGAGFRYDDIEDIELGRSVKRQPLDLIQKGDVRESNVFAYAQQHFDLPGGWSINAGLRYDHFNFGYRNLLAGETNFRKQGRGVVSPKLNINQTLSDKVRFFVNTGIGFHSNDTRVILDNQAEEIVPRVYGVDVGMIVKPAKNLLVKATLWHLYSEQEFVYVGDEGIIEPGGATRRSGIDLSARYQLAQWLFADLDLNMTRARSVDVPKGEDLVPLSPSFTSIGGLTAKDRNGFSGSLRYRYIKDRPANEFNTVVAEGYFLVDAVARYNFKNWEVFASFENLLNTEWREAQFDTESRLRNEPDPVSEIHYTPGTPRFFKAGVSFSF